ncbi:hypothetical protein [Hymenobacter crusticola]|uniref:Uncharacterized protein n=1 Tax=Hymenobacter crusticola TaxID=1770526 RepID=A0A243W826_9BACT|nr:hypothetical protein [Hymenobacter crusticola]OUJ71050.1 hypothetical protein BXP70_23090 [Hymenobacter crusticola]
MEDLTHTPASRNEDSISPKGNSPVTWSIRGVERDTRAVIEKAAERAGKTIGQYVNEDIRSLVQGQLVQSPLPAAPVTIQQQIDHLTKIVEGIATRLPEPGKKSVWQRLFG